MDHFSKKKLMKRVYLIVMTHPVWMSLSLCFAAVSAVSFFIPFLVVRDILETVFSGTVPSGALRGRAFAACAAAALNMVSFMLSLVCSHMAGFATSEDLRSAMARRLSGIPLGYTIMKGSSYLHAVMDDMVSSIQSFICHRIPDMAVSVVYPVSLVLLIAGYDPLLGSCILTGTATAYLFQYLSLGSGGVKKEMELYYDALSVMNTASGEYVRGMREAKLFSTQAGPYASMIASVRDYTAMTIPYTERWSKYRRWYEVIISNTFIFLLPAAGYMILSGLPYEMCAPRIIFYLILAQCAPSVIGRISSLSDEVMRLSGCIERYDEVMGQKEMVFGDGSFPAGSDIVFDHVTFDYSQGSSRPALEDVSFVCPAGTVTAIVGASGSGKSTICHLAARFWDPSSGRILLGDTDLRDISADELSSNVGFIFQDDHLFRGSVLYNIRLGRPGAADEMVMEAAARAGIHERIMKLPMGYDTLIGPGGARLSGGERQRIIIARTILKDADLVILDEATASQDAENEHMILSSFRELMKGKTVLMIAHRLSGIRDASQILVMDQGRIAERGTHDELMGKKGIYHRLWSDYTQTLDWKISQRGGGDDKAYQKA